MMEIFRQFLQFAKAYKVENLKRMQFAKTFRKLSQLRTISELKSLQGGKKPKIFRNWNYFRAELDFKKL